MKVTRDEVRNFLRGQGYTEICLIGLRRNERRLDFLGRMGEFSKEIEEDNVDDKIKNRLCKQQEGEESETAIYIE